MATEVLSAHAEDGQLFHQPGSRRLSPASSSIFLVGSSPPTLSSSPTKPPYTPIAEHNESITSPPASSLDSSPRPSTLDFSNTSSFSSTPISSGLSLEDQFRREDDIDFPNYDGMQPLHQDGGSSISHKSTEYDSEAPEISTTTDTTASDSPLPTPSVSDDTAIKSEPSRHVDYLSHDWREEDIWSSWRHIVSQRRVYGERSRLENASWRTWAKSKYRLRTVSPERLNWLKESDVTWLYGPLKPAETHPITSTTSGRESSQISKSGSFINKKPILKKRSVSEVMLQKSISNSSLVKQAAAAVQAQQERHSRRSTNHSNYTHSSAAPSNPPSREGEEVDYFNRRRGSTEVETPSEGQKEKHLRFDEKVEQCIAVEFKEHVFDESEMELESRLSSSALSDSSSDEGLFMLNRPKRHGPKKDASQKTRISRSNSSSGQMIEKLDSTTLRTDSPDVTTEAQQHHVFGKGWNTGKISPSPSQETLRPSRPSKNFLLADDDDEAERDGSFSWSFGANNPKSSLGQSAHAESSTGRQSGTGWNSDGYDGVEGMRRTESGMFMPYDEDEDDLVANGLFGRVSETFNTARDIFHVITNVGWRK